MSGGIMQRIFTHSLISIQKLSFPKWRCNMKRKIIVLTFVFLAVSSSLANSPLRLIIDTDPAMGDSDPDDITAIIYAFQSRELCTIEGITYGYGNFGDQILEPDGVTRGGERMLDYYHLQLNKMLEVLEEAGAITSRPLLCRGHKLSETWDNNEAHPQNGASDFIRETVRDNAGEITVIALGTLTNIATAMANYPNGSPPFDPDGFMRDCKELWIIGGGFDWGNVIGCDDDGCGYGIAVGSAEWNIWRDRKAAEYVLKHAVKDVNNEPKIKMVPLDSTMCWLIATEHITDITNSNTRITDFLEFPLRWWTKEENPSDNRQLDFTEEEKLEFARYTNWKGGIRCPKLRPAFPPYDTIGMALALESGSTFLPTYNDYKVYVQLFTGETIQDSSLEDRNEVRVFESVDETTMRDNIIERWKRHDFHNPPQNKKFIECSNADYIEKPALLPPEGPIDVSGDLYRHLPVGVDALLTSYRGRLYFNIGISTIPTNAIITNVKLHLYCDRKLVWADAGHRISIYKCDPYENNPSEIWNSANEENGYFASADFGALQVWQSRTLGPKAVNDLQEVVGGGQFAVFLAEDGDDHLCSWFDTSVDWKAYLEVDYACEDSYEPDDTSSQALWIYSNSPQMHSIYPPADVDWVKFSLSNESQVVIETSGQSGDTQIRLYNSSMNEMEYDNDSGIGSFSRIDRLCGADPLEPGEYYVEIRGYDIIASYDLTFLAVPCGSGNHNPQLTNGQVDPGTGTTSTPFTWSVDYYDADGDIPETKNVYIDGVEHEMSFVSESGSESDGTYRYGPRNLDTADHNYYFYFTDGNGGSCRLLPVSVFDGPQVSSGGAVYFADANLKAAVEAKLGDITNPTPLQMLNLTSLYATDLEITDLTGLEYATNLLYLDLGANDITDLSPLSGLTKLQELGLGSNQNLTFIYPLAGLTNLVELDLCCNDVYDLTPLSGLINLTRLVLHHTMWINYDDLAALSGLVNLRELELWGNDLSDISALSTLVNLRYLDLYDNQIIDISPLSELMNLTHLYLQTNPLNKAAYCIYIPLITENNPGIYLVRDPDPNPGGECPVYFPDENLKTVIEEELLIIDPTPTNLLSLTNLDASYKSINELVGLEYATNLTSLYLHGNLISNISPLSGLSSLTELKLHGNQLTDISPLSELTDLTTLYLNGNQITDISCLSGMTDLSTLLLGGNQVCDISPLDGLSNLTYLDLYSDPLNIAAYCTYLSLILTNNPGINLTYDPKKINLSDFSIFAEQWLKTSCGICDGVDLDQDNDVDIDDLIVFCNHYLGGNDSNNEPNQTVFNWSTYLGGSSDDYVWNGGVATDDNGNIYVAGYTNSDGITDALNTHSVGNDAFVAKISSEGLLQWFRYLGGNGDDQAFGITADSSGNVFIAGFTSSSDFNGESGSPPTPNAFIVKVDPAGSLLWTRYFGGSDSETAAAVIVDAAGNVYITGDTNSNDLPSKQNNYQGGSRDAYVAKFSSSGTLLWSIYVGGSINPTGGLGYDWGMGIAVSASGVPWICGATSSTDLDNAVNTHNGGHEQDAFIAKIAADGSFVDCSRYIGGMDGEQAYALVLDNLGNPFVTGYTNSTDFENTYVINSPRGGDRDVFLTKLNTSCSPDWSMYVGGNGYEWGRHIAVDDSNVFYIVGTTASDDFDEKINNKYSGEDCFVTAISSAGSIQWSRYIGGVGKDVGKGIAWNNLTGITVGGWTDSDDFVDRNNGRHGNNDGFVCNFSGD